MAGQNIIDLAKNSLSIAEKLQVTQNKNVVTRVQVTWENH